MLLQIFSYKKKWRKCPNVWLKSWKPMFKAVVSCSYFIVSSGVDLPDVKLHKKSFECTTVDNIWTSVHMLWSSDNNYINCDNSLWLTHTGSEISDTLSQTWLHIQAQVFSTLLPILSENFMNKTLLLRTKELVYLGGLSIKKAEKILIIWQDRPKGKEFCKLTICHFKTLSQELPDGVVV